VVEVARVPQNDCRDEVQAGRSVLLVLVGAVGAAGCGSARRPDLEPAGPRGLAQ
jgi:hypothetical protein